MGPDLTVRYNCLGYPYRGCEVCGAKEVRITKSGKLHATHLKGPTHREAVREMWGSGKAHRCWVCRKRFKTEGEALGCCAEAEVNAGV